jgi:septal ring-binding cell division protein DamX
MNENKDYQSELFEEFQGKQPRARKFIKRIPHTKKFNIVVSQEKIIFSIIALVILFTIFFSLGVERGKRVQLNQNKENIKLVKQNKNAEPKTAQQLADRPTDITPEAQVQHQVQNDDIADQQGEVYTVQVAAYKQIKQAQQAVDKLKESNYQAFTIKKGNYNIIYVGRFNAKQQALKVREELKPKYKDCFVRKLKLE